MEAPSPPLRDAVASPVRDAVASTARPSEALVATAPRWAATSAGLVAASLVAVAAWLGFTHAPFAAAPFERVFVVALVVVPLLVVALLRAEEARLARDLRTARTGSPVLRGLVVRRRQEMPFLARWAATNLGTAALLLADGDREGAVAALASASRILRGGRIETLRALVDADLERNTRTAAGLDRCVQALRAAAPTGSREADLYRVHVLVKAVLERGDDVTAEELASELGAAPDDEQRVYATWLRVWFEFDALEGSEGSENASVRGLSEGDVRMALLAARAHGAERLVDKLTERLSAIAPPERRG